jgi:GntR family histidine utilization transcriptional repressor
VAAKASTKRTAAASGASLHERIFSDVRTAIASGEWPPGRRIPFEHEFCDQYACSRMTVNKALSRLAEAGLIERRRRSGSFVAQPNAQSAALRISDVDAEVAALGLKHRFEVLSYAARRAAARDRALLDLPEGARVLAIECRHFAGEAPFCLEHRLVNLAAVPEAAAEPPQTLIAKAPWTRAEHVVSAENASREVAAALGLAKGAAILVVVRRTWREDLPVTGVKLSYAKGRELVARFSPNVAK